MILHIDMDAFYASIEQRDHPELRGKPVVVGGSKTGRGVVSAASYEARKFGVHSAMPGRRAAELCPDAIFVRGRLSHYADVGRQVREIFLRYTPIVQPLSLDEAFLDVSGTERLNGDAVKVGREIKEAIQSELDLTASVGIASKKFVAKIASDYEKPDGFVVVPDDQLHAFLDPLPLAKLWGVGKVGGRRLQSMGFRTVGDLRRCDPQQLGSQLGEWGQHLWRLANAIDSRAVVPDHSAKQISHERTFSSDQSDLETLRAVLCHLCEQTAMRLRRSKRKSSSVTLKYRREDFRTFSKSKKLPTPTDNTNEIFSVVLGLLDELRAKQPRPVRLIGVSLSSLIDADVPCQLQLFDDPDQKQAEREVDRVVDELSQKLGTKTIYRATGHRWQKRDG